MTTKHQVSSLEIYVAWKQTKQNVYKSCSCPWSFLQYWMDSKIRRIWVGLILLYESVGIKCAMYDQHVEY